MQNKTIEFSNSIIKNRIEILENTALKLVFRTFLEPNGGQNQLHYHSKLNETFKVVEGELTLFIDKTEKKLACGETYCILHKTNHMFLNTSQKQVIFDVEIINPKKIINALQIIYGLANNGKTTKHGLPKNIFHIAICLNMMDTFSPKVPYVIQKYGFLAIASIGRIFKIEKRLVDRYCLSSKKQQ